MLIFHSAVSDHVRGLVHFQPVAETAGASLPEGLHFQCDQRRGVPQGRGQAQTPASRPLRLQVIPLCLCFTRERHTQKLI
jgi:hypothetical protein